MFSFMSGACHCVGLFFGYTFTLLAVLIISGFGIKAFFNADNSASAFFVFAFAHMTGSIFFIIHLSFLTFSSVRYVSNYRFIVTLVEHTYFGFSSVATALFVTATLISKSFDPAAMKLLLTKENPHSVTAVGQTLFESLSKSKQASIVVVFLSYCGLVLSMAFINYFQNKNSKRLHKPLSYHRTHDRVEADYSDENMLDFSMPKNVRIDTVFQGEKDTRFADSNAPN